MSHPFDVNASPVAWREAGEGQLVLFLHGLGGSRIAWEPQLEDLSDRWRCLAWDLPGYGESEPFSGPMTFPGAAAAVEGLIETAEASSAHLVGMSLGGMVALHTAISHPRLVRTLSLIASSPAFGFDGTTTAEDWKAERLAPLDRGETLASLGPRILRAIAGAAAPDSVVEEANAALQRIPIPGFRAAVECLPSHDVRAELPNIEAPTLVLVGDGDTETPVPYSRYLADHIPSSRLEIVPDAGHLLNLESPTTVNAHLRRFLTEQEGDQ